MLSFCHYLFLNIEVVFWCSQGLASLCYFYSKTNQMHQCIKFILFWNDTLHVSDGLSVHHQQFKTVHTATGIHETDTAVCLLKQTAVSVWQMPVAVCAVLNCWWWMERPSETCRVSFDVLLTVHLSIINLLQNKNLCIQLVSYWAYAECHSKIK